MDSNEINYSWNIADEKDCSTFDKYVRDFVGNPKEREIKNSINIVSSLVDEIHYSWNLDEESSSQIEYVESPNDEEILNSIQQVSNLVEKGKKEE